MRATGVLHWCVEDTLVAYQQLALLHRQSLAVPLIAVTVPLVKPRLGIDPCCSGASWFHLRE